MRGVGRGPPCNPALSLVFFFLVKYSSSYSFEQSSHNKEAQMHLHA